MSGRDDPFSTSGGYDREPPMVVMNQGNDPMRTATAMFILLVILGSVLYSGLILVDIFKPGGVNEIRQKQKEIADQVRASNVEEYIRDLRERNEDMCDSKQGYPVTRVTPDKPWLLEQVDGLQRQYARATTPRPAVAVTPPVALTKKEADAARAAEALKKKEEEARLKQARVDICWRLTGRRPES
jgi:hypothetical protein